ncbi:MAG: RES domain-containing protein [Bdellovibrio sp.]|nr:RES domain-containing protein [Bdellovibrio sp.]
MIDHIKTKGEQIDECSFCGAEDVMAIELTEFKSLVTPVINLYTAITNFYPMEILKEQDNSENMIWDKLTHDWGIFDDPSVGESILSSIYEDDPRDGTFYDFMNDAVDIEDDWYEEFSTKANLWSDFCYEIRHVNRFAPKTFANEIIDKIIEANQIAVEVGTILYRARTQQENKPYTTNKMGPPPPKDAVFGRLNPQGIAYLYLSDNPETCVSEIRPDTTSEVSIGTFKIVRECRFVELTSEYIGSPFKWGKSFPMIYRYKNFLNEFGKDISKPINPKSSYLDYLPTQFVSEYIKQKGYDGIVFKSSSGSGLNYTLFNHKMAKCIDVRFTTEIKANYSFKLKTDDVI